MAAADGGVLTFVTSLRHPDTTDDYLHVERLLTATLESLTAQTSTRFRVVVVANRQVDVPPDLPFAVDVVTVGFPPPQHSSTKRELHERIKIDKGSKLAVAVSRIDTGYVMALDADDFVNRELVAWVAEHPGGPGWYVDRGIRYDPGLGVYARQRRFNEVCGTSLIWNRQLLPQPGPLTVDDPVDVIEVFGRDCVVDELGSHRVLRERYGLAPLPFPGAVYTVNHGANHSGRRSFGPGLPVSARLCATYGLPAPPPARWRHALLQFVPRRGSVSIAALRTTLWRVWQRLRHSR